MRKSLMSGIAAGVIGGAMMLSGGSAPVSAATLPSSALAAPGQTAMVDRVQFGFGFGYGYGHRYGPSYGYSGYPYYGGYPYHGRYRSGPSFGFGFTVPGTTYGLAPGYGGSSNHVQWCMNRYRTYDPATDTYIPRVGERAYCNSPYN